MNSFYKLGANKVLKAFFALFICYAFYLYIKIFIKEESLMRKLKCRQLVIIIKLDICLDICKEKIIYEKTIKVGFSCGGGAVLPLICGVRTA